MGGRAPGLACSRSQAGFTLLEMVVVLVVLAFALSIVASRGPMRSRTLEARLAASQMAEQLRLARTQAIATDRPVSFVLDLAARRWQVAGAAAHQVADGTAVSMLSVGQTEGRASGEDEGAAVTGAPGLAPTRRLGAISFAPDGSSSGGRIELTQGGRRTQVAVDWLTGRVSVAEMR